MEQEKKDEVVKLNHLQEDFLLNAYAGFNIGIGIESLFFGYVIYDKLLGIVGNKKLMEILGKEKWDRIKLLLQSRKKYIMTAYIYRLGIKTEQISRDDIASPRFQMFQKSMFQVKAVQYWLFKINDILLEQTSLKNIQEIPQKYYDRVKVEPYKFIDKNPMPSSNVNRDFHREH